MFYGTDIIKKNWTIQIKKRIRTTESDGLVSSELFLDYTLLNIRYSITVKKIQHCFKC